MVVICEVYGEMSYSRQICPAVLGSLSIVLVTRVKPGLIGLAATRGWAGGLLLVWLLEAEFELPVWAGNWGAWLATELAGLVCEPIKFEFWVRSIASCAFLLIEPNDGRHGAGV